MIRRLILLAFVCLLLAPGTWIRTQLPAPNLDAGIEITRLPVDDRRVGALDMTGIWQLVSENDLFGSYSGLVSLGGAEFLAASDTGNMLRFALTQAGVSIVTQGRYGAERGPQDKFAVDIEALTRDEASGRIWAAYEGLNLIERRDRGLADPLAVRPAAMAEWRGNSGPEAMTRLVDGRFIVVGEGTQGWMGEDFPALLWPGDPVESDDPLAFTLKTPEGYRPTDMAVLPDGRVLILLRKLVIGLPPRFESGLMVADPRQITADGMWTGTLLAEFAAPFPTDNYEGLAIVPTDRFPVTLAIISDDNGVRYQRTLLARFQWDGRAP
ncbi:esterase-like activity of phytase family protein [Parerythrobacter jejuensis]|uniref:Phytase-like domain-containing protein n=1 Tax=Parerythrobacter jejuensis TaxID=795812 RepID=A0A845AQ29_9SPHN|nr:esterase-like activity of phytase family protein [Parerythrobacter jejuensis]MXP31005.1 hypothetical protein [Parerythrobacter jejuensis]MXP33765.1 hypothetical protein [Parerythrobacter jejuensis]